MNFAKTFGGIAAGAVASCVAGFVTAAAGLATFALVPALSFGAVVGLVLAIVNSMQPQSAMGNAAMGGGLGFVGYMLTTAAVMTAPGALVAIVTGFLVGWLYSIVSEAVGA